MRAGRILAGEAFATFVQPVHAIPPEISGYTGITRAHVKNAPRAAEALLAFSRFVGDATLIATMANGSTCRSSEQPANAMRCPCARLPSSIPSLSPVNSGADVAGMASIT